MLSATSGKGVRTPSFTAKEACTDSNHLYQPVKIETEDNSIKHMPVLFFEKMSCKEEWEKMYSSIKFFLNVMTNKD